MRESPPERAAGCSALLGTDGLVVLETSNRVPIDVPIRDLEFVLVEFEFVFDEFDRNVDGILLEVDMVGCLLEVERFGCLLEGDTAGVLLPVKFLNNELDLVVCCSVVVFRELSAGRLTMLLGWLLRIRCEFEVLPDELLVVILFPILDVMLELMLPLELFSGRLTMLLGWLLRVRCEFEVLPDEFLVVILLPILDVILELIRPLELPAGFLTMLLGWLLLFCSEVEVVLLRFDELEFDLVVICRPSTLEFGAVGVLTDVEPEEGRRIKDEEFAGRVIFGREIVDREVAGRDIADREVFGLDIVDLEVVDREVFGRLVVTLLGVRLEVLRLVVTLLVDGRLDVVLLDLWLDVTVLELLEDVALDDDWAEEDDLVEDELLRLVLPDRLDADITGSAISAKISNKSIKNKGWKAKGSFPPSVFCVLYSVFWLLFSVFCIPSSVFCFFLYIIRLLSSAFTSKLLFHPLKAKKRHPVTKIPRNTGFFRFFLFDFVYHITKGVIEQCSQSFFESPIFLPHLFSRK